MASHFFDALRRYFNTYSSMFCRRDRNLWVFGAWFGNKFSDNPKYLFLYCLKHGKNVAWITRNPDVFKEMSEQGLPVYMHDTKEAVSICRKAGYCICCTGVEDASRSHLGGAVFINLWHGVPLKKIVYDDIYSKVTVKQKIYQIITAIPFRKEYYFSTSNQVSRIYRSCFATDEKHIIQIGQVRNDMFFDGSLKRIHYSDVDYKKLLVYMPTHRNEGQTEINLERIFDLEDLNDFCKENGLLFLIKKHYYHQNEKTDLSAYSNIIDYTSLPCDTQELLFNADILVTDYSSCYIDYLLLDRPIVFYNYDYEEYLKKDREMYYNYEDVTPGGKAENYYEFRAALKKALNGNEAFCTEHNRVKNLFYSKENQGPVCKKTIEAIEKL